MLKFVSHDASPALYYAILHFTMPLLGQSPVALRIPPLVFGILTIPLAFWVVKRADFTVKDQLLAALLVSASSVLIYYSQEARPYTMLAFFGLLSVGLLLQGLRKASTGRADLAYVAVLFIVCYTHRYGYFLVLGHLCCLLLYRQWRRLVIASLAFLVVLVVLGLQIKRGMFGYGDSGHPANVYSIYSLANSLNVGTVGMQHESVIPDAQHLGFSLAYINRALLLCGAMVFLVLFAKAVTSYNALSVRQRQFINVLMVCMIVPIILALLAGSPFSPRPQWLLRGLIFVWPLYYVVAVCALTRQRMIQACVISLIVVLNGFSLFRYYTSYTRFPDADAFQKLNLLATGKDLIVADPWVMYEVVRYYYHGNARLIGFSEEKGWLDVESMEKSNEFGTIAASRVPQVEGSIYVYNRKRDLKWIHTLRSHAVMVHQGAGLWQLYNRPDSSGQTLSELRVAEYSDTLLSRRENGR
jgi:uncharacterized membrane protein